MIEIDNIFMDAKNALSRLKQRAHLIKCLPSKHVDLS